MEVLLIIILIALILFVIYRFYTLLLSGKFTLRAFIKLHLVYLPIGVVLAGGIWLFDIYSLPGSFKNAISLLRNNDSIAYKIGRFESYTYEAGELPKETDNPAKIQLMLTGSRAKIYLRCEMRKKLKGEWQMVSIQQDSLKPLSGANLQR